MSIRELISLCRRRWILLPSALLVAVLITFATWVTTPTKYQSQVQMTMLNSEAVTNSLGDLGNPYLAFSTALSADVDYLNRLLLSSDSAQQLHSLGVTETYTAAFANNALGPFMLITVTGHNRAHVLTSVNILIKFAQDRWYQIQRESNAPSKSIVKLISIAPPSNPAPVSKSKIELAGGVGIGSIIIALILVVAVDNARRNRQRRKALPTDDRPGKDERPDKDDRPGKPSKRTTKIPSMR